MLFSGVGEFETMATCNMDFTLPSFHFTCNGSFFWNQSRRVKSVEIQNYTSDDDVGTALPIVMHARSGSQPRSYAGTTSVARPSTKANNKGEAPKLSDQFNLVKICNHSLSTDRA